jgi:MOSC domain-containing protein YiiM
VTIAARMQDPHFVKKFRRAEKPGAYCRVIETGRVQAGDPVDLIPFDGERVSIIEFMRIYYQKSPPADDLRRLIRTPIIEKAKVYYEKLLAGEPAEPF